MSIPLLFNVAPSASRWCRRLLAHRLLVSLAAVLLAGPLSAAPAGALIDASERELAADIGWLVDRGVLELPLGTWPLPRIALEAALARPRPADLSAADADALARVEGALRRLDEPAAASAAVNSAEQPPMNGENNARARSVTSLTAQRVEGETALRIRLNHEDRPIGHRPDAMSLQGSYVARAWGNSIVSFGQIDRWWGPAAVSSPIVSNAAPAIPTVSLRRAIDAAPSLGWLEWIGPWGYELSVGRLQQYTPDGANLIGLRLYTRPWHGIEIGVSRSILWGGQGRPKSLRSLGKALIGRTNPSRPDDPPDPSAEIAGFDLRVAAPLPSGDVVAGYVHMVGEDRSGAFPTKLFGTLGLQFRQALGAQRIDWTLEGTDTITGRFFRDDPDHRSPAYRHGIYTDGYYHLGMPIGASIGGGGQRLSLGMALTAPPDWPIDRLHLAIGRGRANQTEEGRGDPRFVPAGRINDLLVRVDSQLGRGRWHLGVSVQDDNLPQRRTAGIVAGVEWPLQWRP